MNRNKAFTLIELLVVIAIIALLISILMPALAKVKEKTRQTVCKTNLKGIGLSISLYLNEFKNRTFPKHGNGYKWKDSSTGKLVDPENGYWGLAYNDYSENPEVFSCSTFASMKNTIYTIGDGDILGGFGLNRHFEDMKVNSIKVPAQFIIAQDHVEPHPEDKDLFYVDNKSYGYNLEAYRTTSRSEYYWTIFRHSKRSRNLDENPNDPTRLSSIPNSPNGQSNTLWLDCSVTGMDETNGKDIPESWYSGK